MRYILRACIVRENGDAYVDELIRYCKYADIDEIMMCEDNDFVIAISQPLETHKVLAEEMKKAVKKCRDAGIRCSFYLKALVGHFTSDAYVLPYTKFVGINGQESDNECCLLDEGFADYAAKLMSYYAECGFDSMMFDDDFRSVNHLNGQAGCFCDLHVQRTAKRYGKPLSREKLIYALKNFDEESVRIKKCFREVNFEGQLAFLSAVEKAVHAVDPAVQLGLMSSGLEADQYQGRDMKKLLKTFAGESATPFIRPPGGEYLDSLGTRLFYALDEAGKYRAKFGDEVRMASEVDVCPPRNIFAKSVKMLDLQCGIHALGGYEELTLNIFEHYGTPLSESMEYLNLLKENKRYYERLNGIAKGKIAYGVGLALPDNYVESLKDDRYGCMEGNNPSAYYLHRLGLPVAYRKTEVNFLTGALLNCYSDEELTEFFKGGVILDEEAVKGALERGFAEYIGIESLVKAEKVCMERLTEAKENGDYVGDRFPCYTGNGNAYLLKAKKGATVLTEYIDAGMQKLGDCVVYYENALGGRVFSTGARLSADRLYHKGVVLQWHEVAKKLFKGALPFNVKNAVSIAPIWFKGQGKDEIVLYNFGLDHQKIEVEFVDEVKSVDVPPLSLKIL